MVVPINNRPSLLREQDKDLHDMLGVAHPLHRRRVCLGIQKIKDKEEEEVSKQGSEEDLFCFMLPFLGRLF